MVPAMTKAEAKAWRERWHLVNEFQREELRRTPVGVKVRQLAAMMDMAHALDWQTSTPAELERVRARWCQLKKDCPVGS
jgi:hypothetical protein